MLTRDNYEYTQMRACYAWNLRQNGLSYARIAKATGVSTNTACLDILRYMKRGGCANDGLREGYEFSCVTQPVAQAMRDGLEAIATMPFSESVC